MPRIKYNGLYSGETLSRVAFPLGGLGAGMFCLEGAGALSHFSLRHKPDVFNEPLVFSALWVKGQAHSARVLEGPVPAWKIFGAPGTGNGAGGKNYGLPRMAQAGFRARFPFATVTLAQPALPLRVELTGWSPFIPGDADNSSLPVAGLEFRFVNTSRKTVQAVYSFHAANFMAAGSKKDSVLRTKGGFILWEPGTPEKPHDEGACAAWLDEPAAKANCAWFRGGWFDHLTMNWKLITAGACPGQPPFRAGQTSRGGSVFLPFTLKPGREKIVRLKVAWHVKESALREGKDPRKQDEPAACACGASAKQEKYRPWYAARFQDIHAIIKYWRGNYGSLRERTARFTDCFYNTSLPDVVLDAVAANLSILKSPTVLRQGDGRLWAWEGCNDGSGCCAGTCTHVWNYAQALPHLFPELERSLRETEFVECQNEKGHQTFRAGLPIRPVDHDFHAAADGQLGGLMKLHRDWRIAGDTAWLRKLWPQARRSLDYCIQTWDPGEKGILEEPHHNTYDIEFWGPDGMCGSFYLGALKAAALMSAALGEDATRYQKLFEKGRRYLEERLFNGEYFEQEVRWQGLRAQNPVKLQSWTVNYSPEALALLRKEGPKYQYGRGCLSDGVLGAWLAEVCGVGEILDAKKVAGHLRAVHRHNFKKDLSDHVNPQRPSFALGQEAGLLLCTWPRGGRLSLPFPYSEEVFTGIEYQVASHLMLAGQVQAALQIVRAVRDRYDGRVRNPFNEYECGHWYARALSSYALLQGLTGIRYDALNKTLEIKPRLKGDFRSFLATAAGYGLAGVKRGQPFLEVHSGTIEVKRIDYRV